MENISNMKRRLTIVAWIMGILIVALSGTLIGVLAASNQSLGSNFSISYDIGQNVAMKLRYKVNGAVGEMYDAYGTPYERDNDGYVTFDSNIEVPIISFDGPHTEIDLSPDNPSWTLEFDIVNIASTPMIVDWTDGVIAGENLNVEMSINGTVIDPSVQKNQTVNNAESLTIKFVLSAVEVNDFWEAEFVCAISTTSAGSN